MKNNKGESYLHSLMKTVAANKLREEGMSVKIEERTFGNSTVDVVGTAKDQTKIVECETLLYPCHEKLKTSFSKALIRFGQKINAVLCIPKFTNFSEIWVVDETGYITKYQRDNYGAGN